MNFEKMSQNIYRLKVPFADNYTAVFAIVDGNEVILYDSGDSESDVQLCILPALEKLGLVPTILVASHAHRDHAGGLPALSEAFPNAKIKVGDPLRHKGLECKAQSLYDGEALSTNLVAVALAGHSSDMMGIFDKRERILLTGDGLQQWGISRWGTIVTDRRAYMRSLDKVEDLDIECIIASHEYAPLGSVAEGREEILELLSECRETMYDIEDFVYECGSEDVDEILRRYGVAYPQRPPLFKSTVKNILK